MNKPDVRIARVDSRPLTTKSAYSTAFEHLQDVPFATPTWKNYSTNRCRMFLWLADRGRLFTNQRRFRKGLASSDSCPFCPSAETTEHLFLHCPSVSSFWMAVPAIQGDIEDCTKLRDLWGGAPVGKVRSTIIICALWNLWKRRNTKVFRNIDEPMQLVFRRCAEDLLLWNHRCQKQPHKELIHDWAVMFAHLGSH
uniref:Uncharacterized protein n=1 Tax=Avena sativa TaxID=4498 RepID=A0ACD5TRX0_AVESA